MKNKNVKIGDIICYHNLDYNELYFHQVVEFKKDEYRVICLHTGYGKIPVGFDFKQPHIHIKHPKLLKLILC